MSQEEFDFTTFQEKVAARRDAEIVEARDGLKILEERHEDLISQRCELDDQIATLDKKIGDLSVFLGGEEAKEKDAPQRDRGVLVVLRKVASPEWDGIGFTKPQDFDAVVKQVRQIKPTAKEATIRSGLLRLTRTGVLEVVGKRGDRQWRLCPPASVDDGTDAEASEKPGEPEVETTTQEPAEEAHAPESTPTRPHDEVVADVCESVMVAVTKSKDGIGAKTIAWIMSETGADDGHFEAAVGQLESQGQIEIGKSLQDSSQVIRLPADPDSKEALKRTRVSGTPLFPNADTPSHA
jgi:hypothetical protein